VATIRLQVPGVLQFRDLCIRVVAAACKLVPARGELTSDAHASFDDEVISAFGEAFNNAAIHSYRGQPAGSVDIEIDVATDHITLRICDYGRSFDPTQVLDPDLDALPESGLGLYIMRSFMDTVLYEAGAPNVLSMTKHLRSDAAGGGAS
jgi:serine/threonine-protein kinase RsbW